MRALSAAAQSEKKQCAGAVSSATRRHHRGGDGGASARARAMPARGASARPCAHAANKGAQRRRKSVPLGGDGAGGFVQLLREPRGSQRHAPRPASPFQHSRLLRAFAAQRTPREVARRTGEARAMVWHRVAVSRPLGIAESAELHSIRSTTELRGKIKVSCAQKHKRTSWTPTPPQGPINRKSTVFYETFTRL